MNSKEKGAVGVATAVAHYSKSGYAVFVPVSDISKYDLIIDNGSGPLRVEVKTTGAKTGIIELRTIRHNSQGYSIYRSITKESCDVVFCYNLITDTFKEFEASELEGRNSVTVR